MKRSLLFVAAMFALLPAQFCSVRHSSSEIMMYGDTTRQDTPYAKDPYVIRHGKMYRMYYTEKNKTADTCKSWSTGIAESKDLVHWTKIGDIEAVDVGLRGGEVVAPCLLERDGVIHLFYQSKGRDMKYRDICHATSSDGIHFTPDPTNPVFAPTGDWNSGRAIDAEVHEFKGKYFMYFATRDTTNKIQQLGVATAPLGTDFSRGQWTQACDTSILYPSLPWEGECIEAPSVIVRGDKIFMFYAGAYNNWPQQIGVAVSDDGLNWKRVWDTPFLPKGEPGTWNESESGHPDIFLDKDGRTYLFFQGNNTKGKDWYLSQKEVIWKDGLPQIKQ